MGGGACGTSSRRGGVALARALFFALSLEGLRSKPVLRPGCGWRITVSLARETTMPPALLALIDRWIKRAALPDAGAIAAVAHLIPAVVVTGGSDGIGLEIAREFAKLGRAVFLVARDEARLAAAQAYLDGAGSGVVSAVSLDITSADAPSLLDGKLAEHGYYLDVLVNSAGLGLSGPFDTHSEAEIAQLLALNIGALTRLTRHVLPGMRARARGGILNIASLGGTIPGPFQAAYYASKAYVCSLTEALAAELPGSGVRICVVAPGPVETRFHARMNAEDALYRHLLPALSPQRTARAAVFHYLLGRRVVVPGLLPKAAAVCIAILPHFITVPVVAVLLRPRQSSKLSLHKN